MAIGTRTKVTDKEIGAARRKASRKKGVTTGELESLFECDRNRARLIAKHAQLKGKRGESHGRPMTYFFKVKATKKKR